MLCALPLLKSKKSMYFTLLFNKASALAAPERKIGGLLKEDEWGRHKDDMEKTWGQASRT